jgi:MFS family permease
MLNLADVLSVRGLIAGAAMLGAMSNLAFALFVDGPAGAIPLRFLTGVALAGVYPPGMKLIATWFKARRGLAIGVLVGSLSLGSGSPHFINGVSSLSWHGVLAVSSALACVGAVVMVAFVREGPFTTAAPAIFPGYAVTLFRDRPQRLVNFGYFGHMWELYAFWTWLPAYVGASYAAWSSSADTRLAVGLTAFVTIALAGLGGCLAGGQLSDRHGRAELTIGAMIVSGACCLASALVYGLNPALVVLLLLVWGATVIADSAQFSACLTELADPRYVGTALTVQTAIGFLLTVVSIRLLPVLESAVGWRFAFVGLAFGPALGALSMARLRSTGALRQERLDLVSRLSQTVDSGPSFR